MRRTLERIRDQRIDPQEVGADVHEDDEGYSVVFDAPGVELDDVQVRYLDGRVMMRVERFRDMYEGFELHESGRTLSFEGEIELPDDAIVTPESGQATVRANGTLHIRIPKDAAASDPEMPTHVIE